MEENPLPIEIRLTGEDGVSYSATISSVEDAEAFARRVAALDV